MIAVPDGSNTVFVFPSEIVASSWAGRIAELQGVARKDRFISWDRFKELTFFGLEERKPANRLFRNIFVYQLLEHNRQKPFLSILFPPRFGSDADLYAPVITGLLPHLARILTQQDLHTMLGRALFNDLQQIRNKYHQFLNDHERYEPAGLNRKYMSDGRRYQIFHSQLLEDIEEYRWQLEESDEVRLMGESEGLEAFGGLEGLEVATNLDLYEFDDYRQEFYRCLEQVAALLQQGVRPERIAITLADYNALYPRLAYIARNLGVPLNRRRGRPLLGYSAVSWLQDLTEMGGDFSFHAVRNFLLHPGLPWKNPAENRRLIARAINAGLVEGGFAAWKRMADQMPASRGLFDALRAIVRADSMQALRSSLYRFLKNHTDTNSWSKADASAWQWSITQIKEMELELSEFPDFLGGRTGRFALAQLQASSYLPQSSGSGGIGVYDYRVNAGLETDYHFCLNFCAEAVTIRRQGLQFLREDILQKLFDTSSDSTEHFLRAYASSGKNVWISYSRRGRGTEQLPASPFLASDRVQKGFKARAARYEEAAPGPGSGRGRWADRVTTVHNKVWSGIADSGLREQFIPPALSVSRLESWLHCPLGYFWHQCGLELLELSPQIWPFQRIGTLLHRILEKLYRRISDESDGYFRPGRIDNYRQAAAEIQNATFEDWKQVGAIPAVLHNHLQQLFTESINNILEDDARQGRDFRIFELEFELEAEFGGLRLKGRVDRIMQDPESGDLQIIDYKAGSPPRPVDILGTMQRELFNRKNPAIPAEPGQLAGILRKTKVINVQLFAYSLLLRERAGARGVSQAGYYSIKRGAQGSYKAIFGREGMENNRSALPLTMPMLIEQMEQSVIGHVSELHKRVGGGDFRVPAQGCERCRHKGLCRHRFSLRMQS